MEMSLDVVDSYQRHAEPGRKPLRGVESDYQRTCEPGAVCDGNGIDLSRRGTDSKAQSTAKG